MKPKRKKSVWGLIGAVLGAVGVEAGQVAIDAATGAGAGAFRALTEGQVNPQNIMIGAAAGAVLGVTTRYGRDRWQKQSKANELPIDFSDGGDQ